jgi:hypothetical protein
MIDPAQGATVLDPVVAAPSAARQVRRPVSVGRVDGLRLALTAVVGSRLIVWAAAMATLALFGVNSTAWHVLDPSGVTPPVHSGLINALLAPGARWDSVWYLEIAAHGYFSPASTNFFPLYPLLVHLGLPVAGQPILAGVAISIGSMIAGLTLLYRLARLDVSESAARWTVLLVAVFPSSLFMSAVYPTSLFMMLSVAAVYAARQDRWALAGACGGLAAATRSNGILVFVVLALLYLYGPRGRESRSVAPGAWWRPRFRLELDAAWIGLVPLGLVVYLGYLLVAHGAPLEPFRAAHVDWGHSFGPPLSSIPESLVKLPGDIVALVRHTTTAIGPGDPISWELRNLVDVGFLAGAIVAARLAWKRLPRVYVLYALLELAQVTSFPTGKEPMIGLPRYLLPMFPLFMGAGACLAERRVTRRVTTVVSIVLLVVFSGLWGYWALVP